MRAEARTRGIVLASFLAALVAVDLHSCATLAPRVPEVASEASAAFEHARAEEREAAAGWRDRAVAGARDALRVEPTWVAPQRWLDDLARTELIAHARLEERLARLEVPGAPAERARELYLVGRLEGSAGAGRFEQALELDPGLAWAHHGRGWTSHLAGGTARARPSGERALELARDGFERVNFGVASARYELALGHPERAVRVLIRASRGGALSPLERIELGLWRTRAELACEDDVLVERGFWRGIELLRGTGLTDGEVRELTQDLLDVLGDDVAPAPIEEIEAALATSRSPERDRIRGRILFRRGGRGLALGLLSGDGEALRAARFAAGETGAVIADWHARLPAQVLADDGMPMRPALRELLRAAQAEDPGLLAEALLAAGWFLEARGLAANLAATDLDLALDVDARGAAGLALVAGTRRLLELVDRDGNWPGPASVLAGDDPGDGFRPVGERISDLDELLRALEPLFARHRGRTVDLSGSPRCSYGGLAEVVHPGPSFSAEDQLVGRGEEGAAVTGLGAELLSIGRFGLFGQTIGGGGPDGTVLRLLGFEQRSGEHLGVAYGGTVAWCEGVDVPSRPARRGANITGAALHEGFWVDVAGVREEHARWLDLERRFLATEAGRARARAALEADGPRVRIASEKLRISERTRAYAPLGEASRMRLAILLERSEPGDQGKGRVTLEELLEVTARHEEGHLTDRTRFLPLGKNLVAVAGLLTQAGFTPQGLALLLELRAQLVALVVADDARMPLAECVDAVENGGDVTPHAAAYARLLESFLDVLEEARARGDVDLDPERYLVHQLHRLSADEVRTIALEVAGRAGL